jgi:ubiquinone/menaquinone biosynthesis C-methylase UbiE
MPDPDVTARMREDWNARAREDAGYYVAFGRRDQNDEEFFATGLETAKAIEFELRRIPPSQRGKGRALEIGCGPGRLILHLSRNFEEIHGVDVSDEMIARAKEKLSSIPHAHFHATDGGSLAMFPAEFFDFIYSYAVFQHIPSRDVVFQYLREAQRVLKPGGLAWFQFNGLPKVDSDVRLDTWSGARFAVGEIFEFTELHDIQVLALEGRSTQYMWTTWRRHPRGWRQALRESEPQAEIRIRRITNGQSSEPVAPSRGRFASISIWVENLPPDADLHDLHVTVGDSFGTVSYIGAPDNVGLQQVNVLLPELEATGLLPVEIVWLGKRISQSATLRVIPPGPSVPRLNSISDGINLMAGTRIETRTVKMTMEEIARPHEIEAVIDGEPVWNLEFFCIDPRPQRFEVNFRLPESIGPGDHQLVVRMGQRKLAPVTLQVVA